MTTEKLLEQIAAREEELIALRRFFHENPETDAQEKETSAFCRRQMEQLGLSIHPVTEYSFYAVLDTGRPGRTLALRTDIDGLSMDESPENLAGKKVCCSKHPGKAHTCGHDGHMAMLLTASKVLCENRDELVGKLLFVFESGEETDSTSYQIADALAEEGVEAVWGMHLAAHIPEGVLSADPGPRMSGIYMFEYTITGRGGHSSRPDQCVNPLMAAAAIVSAFGNVVPSNLDPSDMGVAVPCVIQGGTGKNIIPEQCKIGGSGRFLREESRIKLEDSLTRLAESIAEGYGCTAKKTYGDQPGSGAPAVVNDPVLSQLAEKAIQKIAPQAFQGPQPPWMASEAFGEYCLRFPCVFAFLGIANQKEGYGAPHHNQHFDFNESVLHLGVEATVQFAVDFLGAK